MKTRHTVKTTAVYGLTEVGPVAVLDAEEVVGATAREMVMRVAQTPQTSDPARRTARILRDAVAHRALDYEVVRGDGAEASQVGEPIGPDEVVVPVARDLEAPRTRHLTLRASEHFVGGRDVGRRSRRAS